MILSHYTNLQNLPLIVKEDGLNFLLTDYNDFDDPLEGRPMWRILEKAYDNKWHEDVWDTFVLSLCNDHDSLPMWKEYTSNATGIALGIETDKLEHGTLYDCVYDDISKSAIEREILQQLHDIREKYDDAYLRGQESYKSGVKADNSELSKRIKEKNAVKAAVKSVIRFKDEHYAYERESRFVCSGHGSMERIWSIKGKKLIHKLHLIEPIDCLSRIYVGPNCGRDGIRCVNEYLERIGLSSKVPVIASTLLQF